MQRTVRKKRKRPMEEKIKSNQMKILQSLARDSLPASRSSRLPTNNNANLPQEPPKSIPDFNVMKSREKTRTMFGRPVRGGLSRKPLARLALLALITSVLRPAHKTQTSASTLSDFDGATFYKAPVGSRIRIACNASHWNDDSISLVLWFKGNPTGAAAQLQPIYTIDARQKPLSSGQARHLVADAFKGRARFVFPEQATRQTSSNSQPAANATALVPFLDLAPIEADDQGEYRCRVDYRARPRENFLIILFVLVPPSSLEISDSAGRPLGQIYGPLNEGSELRLACLSKGGRPPPALVWRRAGHVIDDTYLTLNDFLTLKLANGSGPARDWPAASRQQQQLDAPDNDLAPDRLAASRRRPGDNRTGPREQNADAAAETAADWLAWPEFDYLQAEQLAAGRSSPWTGSGEMQPQTRQPLGARQAPQVAQLIDSRVDPTTTTGVNVLHLSELTRAHLTEEPEESGGGGGGGAGEPRAVPPGPGARLECHASNAHYDLHTLIKLFAPPSLQRPLDAGDTSDKDELAGRNPHANSATLLARSIERAIWANVRSASARAESGQPRPATARVALSSQQQPEDARPLEQAPADWPLVIQQQLIRPHQLAGAALSSAEAAPGPPSSPSNEPPANLKTPTSGASQLSRNKLIALEANLRPLDVKISGPGRALTAGQVHEFTCLSRGSWPAARLTWLKDGRRLNPKLAHQAASAAEQGQGRPAAPSSERDTSHAPSLETYKLSAASWSASSLISQSKLTIKLEREDHNARLSCVAENELFKGTARANATATAGSTSGPDSTAAPSSAAAISGEQADQGWQLEDSLTLSVHYPPQVRLELGTKMLSERIREGQDIYFVCRVDANPAATEITWLHNERPINESRPAGELDAKLEPAGQNRQDTTTTVAGNKAPAGGPQTAPANLIVSNDSLVLQRVQIDQSGQYNCLASNSEGLGLSNQIELRVLHAPVCVAAKEAAGRSSQLIVEAVGGRQALSLGALRLPSKAGDPPLRVACQMLVPHEDEPQQQLDQLEFTWYLNNTFSERRLLARQAGREAGVKLVDARQSELLGLPWQEQPAGESGLARRLGGADTLGRKAGFRLGKSAPDAASQQKPSRSVRLAVAYLNLSWEQTSAGGGADTQIGQLFCLARNSLGEQRRACLYSIEAPLPALLADRPSADKAKNNNKDDDADAEESAAHFSCLFVNVTASSAWIGCNSSGRRRLAASGRPANSRLEVTQLEENNDRLRPALAPTRNNDQDDDDDDDAAANELSRFHFNVLVFSASESAARREGPDAGRQLEANLSSGPLDEALFAVVNLRPGTKYLLGIDDLSGGQPEAGRQTAWVGLETLAEGESAARNHSDPNDGHKAASRPSIRQVTEPHPPDLLAAALISTRSNVNGNQQLYQSAGDHTSRLLQQRQTGGQQSVWGSVTEALAQLVGVHEPAADQRSGAPMKGRRPQHLRRGEHSSASFLAGLRSLELDSLLILSVCLLTLLLVVLVSLVALSRSRLCAGRRRREAGRRGGRGSEYETIKLSTLTGNEAASEDDPDRDDSFAGEKRRSRSVSSSASIPISTPQKKRQLAAGAPAATLSSAATCLVDSERKLENHHYSGGPDSARAAQHPVIAGGQSRPMINFLKSSSIAASATATMQRYGARRHYHETGGSQAGPVMILQADGGLADHSSQFLPTVTRSRSSLGFGADLNGLAAFGGAGGVQGVNDPSAALVLMAQMQSSASRTAEAAAARQRLMQSAGVMSQAEQTSLLAEELRLHSGKWLISNANFSFDPEHTTPTTNVAGSTMTSLVRGEGENHLQTYNGPYIGVRAQNHCKFADSEQPETTTYAIEAARSNKLAQAENCYNKENGVSPHCNCHSLSNNKMTEEEEEARFFSENVCCEATMRGGNQQQCAGFIELLPNPESDGASEQSAILAFHDQSQADYQLACDVQRSSETPNTIMPAINQRHLHDRQYHHVIFNQSLNSSSIGSPSTANQYGSSPLGSLTNTTPSNTESYQHHHNNNLTINQNLVLMTTSKEHDNSNFQPSTRDARSSEQILNAAANTSNYSSDGFSSPATSSTRTTTASTNRKAGKTRLASILKNRDHSTNAATFTDNGKKSSE